MPFSSETATLYVVATPIGNLSDLSPRARDTLASVGLVLCEDTRHTAKLLAHAGIRVPLESLHEHNERDKAHVLLERILALENPTAALVSDAGTPAISDPGAHFVRAARQAGLRVISVPGPSALTSGLAASGLVAPRHLFSAFLPRDAKGQHEEFSHWEAVAPCIGVFYESPQRIVDTLATLEEHFGPDLEVCLSREISKLHEEHLAGTVAEVRATLAGRDRVQGEFVVSVLATTRIPLRQKLTFVEALAETARRVRSGERLKDVVKDLAARNDLDGKELYRRAVEEKGRFE